jgi:hypothetical protein
MIYRIILFHVILSLNAAASSQQVQINEIMSSNLSTGTDEDGEYSDWVEFYNRGDSAVDLTGWHLTDDSLQLEKWVFPSMSFGPGEHLLVWCSGKNRFPDERYYETIIRRGDTWKYRLGDSEPPADWNSLEFNDSGWSAGESGFGYGDGDDNTLVYQTLSLYARKSFLLEDTSIIRSAILSIDFDDAFVAYLNGREIARSHIGIPGNPPAHDDTGDIHEAGIYRGLDPEQFTVENSLLEEGINLLAIQVHNAEWESSDLTLIPYFTLVLDESPESPVGSPPELSYPGSELHSSFKLSSSGEVLILSDSSGNILDSLGFGAIPADISYGRKAGDPASWLYFEDPTPGGPNGTEGIEEIAQGEVLFSPPVKFFNGSMTAALSGGPSDGVIRYTLDGSEPTGSSEVYGEPLQITSSTVIRARIFVDGQLPGRTSSYNYISRDDFDADNMPVIAISTDPDQLYDRDDGLFLNAENRELEKPVHVEFIESDGSVGFSIDAGLKIFGNEPGGGYHQHKLSIFARSKYGYGSIDYHLFPDKPIESFEAIILRNPINEMWDVIASRLIDEEAVANQSYRPSIVFINGEYWGTKFIREKINEHFVASNFGVDPDSVDVIMGIESPVEYYNEEWPIAGDLENYKEMIHWLIDHDLSDSSNYEFISTWIDIHNFISYQVSEIYYGNIDWPGNNMKWWRERTGNGVWRWILFDVDAGMGAWEPSSYNSMLHATEEDGPEQWPNPPWSTFLLRKLLENQSFRDQFVMRSLDLLNTDFTEERLNREIDVVVRETEGEIRNHTQRWEGTYTRWTNDIEDIRYWAKYRATRVRTHIRDYFELGKTRDLALDQYPRNGGQIRMNSKLLEHFPFEGKYIEEFPLELEAIPAYGYRFTGWEGMEHTNREVSMMMDQSMQVTALFEPEEWYEPVVINEINYRSSPDQNAGDWVEIVNNGSETMVLDNWVLKDSDDTHIFSFPIGISLMPGEYLVVCRDMGLFYSIHPGVTNYIGSMEFGLSGGGEMVRLFNSNGQLIDWVEYDDFTPWPMEADGKGGTLALNHPDLDNSVARNWFASASGGTPGRENSVTGPTGIEPATIKMQVSEPWPNPFKERTTLVYQLDEEDHIRVSVYDIQGRLIEVLVDERLQAGEYSTQWNRRVHAPGIYLLRIESGGINIVKKLVTQ